ncbi:Ankyrin repeat domain containing protein [Pandoravirus salinus]|uniref:Ankyrin repeat domain containing protein n=1 Tax=Pandoravirus salinus TaxID=1349410 RepID=A0A291ATR9_9VIRU|nr:ankyrin repeat domain [Pandoravirus salinus]ATE82225.1 Ankyrin repeat domain containing protein [Pandoravirus salinus]
MSAPRDCDQCGKHMAVLRVSRAQRRTSFGQSHKRARNNEQAHALGLFVSIAESSAINMIDVLPDELLCAVFVHLSCFVLRSALPLVCRRWRDVAGDTTARGGRAMCIDMAKTMKRPSRWCDAAAAAGHVSCLAYAHRDLGLAWAATTCQSAAREGHKDCLVFAHRGGCPWDRNTTRVAAANGRLDCFVYAFDNGCDTRGTCNLRAARNGHEDILDATSANVVGPEGAYLCKRAATGGHLGLVRRLCEAGAVPNTRVLHRAVEAGQTAIVRYLVEEHGLQFDLPLWRVIWTGNVSLVRYLCETFAIQGSSSDLYTAAFRRQRKIVMYLLGRGIVADNRTVEKVVKCGWIDAVGLVCAIDPRVADRVATHSVERGRVQCLECALCAGASLDPGLMVRAAAKGNMAVIDLLVQHGIAWTTEAMQEAAQNGHVEALSRARSAGIPFDADACALAAGNGHAETVRYLCNRRCPVDGRARARAAAWDYHAIECYLAGRGCPFDFKDYRLQCMVKSINKSLSRMANKI